MMETTGLGTAWDLQGSEEKLAGVGGSSHLRSDGGWACHTAGEPSAGLGLCSLPRLRALSSPAQPCVLVHGLVFSSSG